MNQHQKPVLPEGGKSRRVYLLLRDETANGTLAAGTLLPGEQKLAESYGVSRVTVRRALEALARDGFIQKKTGAGSIVMPEAATGAPMAADIASLMPQIVAMSRDSTARLISFCYETPPAPVATALRLDPGARVQTAVRVRLAEGQPFSHLTTHVPEDVAGNYDEADLARLPLFRLLERSGVRVSGAQQTVSATLAAPDVAAALDVSVGSALLSLRRVVRDDTGRGIEYLSALYRPDKFRLEMTLDRVGNDGARHWAPVISSDGAQGLA